MRRLFADRAQAGRALAARLGAAAWPAPVVVLALPRGGVPVAVEVARALHVPLDLLMVRKIGAPMHPELAVAAVVDGARPEIVYDEENCAFAGVDHASIERRAAQELVELERRRRAYLGTRAPVSAAGATAIVIDDGLATGTTMRAALKALRRQQPARIVLAVPLAPAETVAALAAEADEVICLAQPSPFHAIGLHYEDFEQVGDDEVVAALHRCQLWGAPEGAGGRES